MFIDIVYTGITDLKGRPNLGFEGLDVLASLALRTRTFSPGLVTPLAFVYLPYRILKTICIQYIGNVLSSQLNQKYQIQYVI